MSSITPCMWFDTQAEDAARFYVSLFADSRIGTISHFGEAGPRPAGMVMTVSFQLEGRPFLALNGGPEFTHSPAVSFIKNVDTQAELDTLWDALLDGGSPQQCGWITDRFGISWQIVPTVLMEIMSGPDAARSQRVMKAMLGMVKLDITRLREAAEAN